MVENSVRVRTKFSDVSAPTGPGAPYLSTVFGSGDVGNTQIFPENSP
jgi:hypothetical protein